MYPDEMSYNGYDFTWVDEIDCWDVTNSEGIVTDQIFWNSNAGDYGTYAHLEFDNSYRGMDRMRYYKGK